MPGTYAAHRSRHEVCCSHLWAAVPCGVAGVRIGPAAHQVRHAKGHCTTNVIWRFARRMDSRRRSRSWMRTMVRLKALTNWL